MVKINLKATSDRNLIDTDETKSAVSQKPLHEIENENFAKDKLKIAEQAETVGKLVKRLGQVPEVRSKKVGTLRQEIRSGKYKPTGEEIADAILKDEK